MRLVWAPEAMDWQPQMPDAAPWGGTATRRASYVAADKKGTAENPRRIQWHLGWQLGDLLGHFMPYNGLNMANSRPFRGPTPGCDKVRAWRYDAG